MDKEAKPGVSLPGNALQQKEFFNCKLRIYVLIYLPVFTCIC